MRPAHTLKGNKRMGFPRRWVFFDVETRTAEHRDKDAIQSLVCGWAVYVELTPEALVKGEDWLFFREREAFWGFVKGHIRSQHKLLLCAHNIGFDFTVLRGFESLSDMGFYAKSLYLNSGIVLGKFQDRTLLERQRQVEEVKAGVRKRLSQVSTVEIRDSANYYRIPLSQVGEIYGLQKLQMPSDSNDVDAQAIYCHRDVEILLAGLSGLLRFLVVNDLGYLGGTISSQAMNCYRHRFMPRAIFIHDRKDVCAIEREAYFGGRTEAFHIGKVPVKPLYVLDFNSLYPAVMKDNLFPRALQFKARDMSLKELKAALQDSLVCARCELETDVPWYPVRPAGKLLFPIGRFETALCTPELKLALESGHLIRVWDVCLYSGAHLFTKYVRELYKLRRRFQREGNRPFADITKRLMNHQYGKWGQLSEDWDTVGQTWDELVSYETGYSLTTGKWITTRILGGEIQELREKGESFNSFPAIAAHATSYARLQLLGAIQRAGRDHVFYCDTDSLFVDKIGLDKLESICSPTVLGRLKVEKSIGSLQIWGCKDYQADGKITRKGIRANAIALSAQDFQQEQFPSLKAILRSADPNTYAVKTVTKHLNRTYDKGQVTASGRVLPLVLGASSPQAPA